MVVLEGRISGPVADSIPGRRIAVDRVAPYPEPRDTDRAVLRRSLASLNGCRALTVLAEGKLRVPVLGTGTSTDLQWHEILTNQPRLTHIPQLT